MVLFIVKQTIEHGVLWEFEWHHLQSPLAFYILIYGRFKKLSDWLKKKTKKPKKQKSKLNKKQKKNKIEAWKTVVHKSTWHVTVTASTSTMPSMDCYRRTHGWDQCRDRWGWQVYCPWECLSLSHGEHHVESRYHAPAEAWKTIRMTHITNHI